MNADKKRVAESSQLGFLLMLIFFVTTTIDLFSAIPISIPHSFENIKVTLLITSIFSLSAYIKSFVCTYTKCSGREKLFECIAHAMAAITVAQIVAFIRFYPPLDFTSLIFAGLVIVFMKFAKNAAVEFLQEEDRDDASGSVRKS